MGGGPNWQGSVRRRDWRGTRPDQARHYQGTDESVCVVVDRSRPPTEWRQPADRLARCRRVANCAGRLPLGGSRFRLDYWIVQFGRNPENVVADPTVPRCSRKLCPERYAATLARVLAICRDRGQLLW